MLETLKKTLYLLRADEKREGLWLMIMLVAMAFLEMLGVASIMPFLSVLSEPTKAETIPALKLAYEFFGFSSSKDFLVALGLVSIFIVIFSSIFRAATTYLINKYTQLCRHNISKRLLEIYIHQPYSFFLTRHTGDMAKGILSEVDQLINNVIHPILNALAYALITLVLIGFLIINNPKLAFAAGIVVVSSYVVIFYLVQKKLRILGRDRVEANRERFKSAGDALGGIKEIKLLGKETAYLEVFNRASLKTSLCMASNNTLGQVPKYLIEALGLSGIVVLALILYDAGGNGLSDALPMIGLYAFAGYKLLPAAQNIYSSATKLKFGAATVDDIYNDMNQRAKTALFHDTVPTKRIPMDEGIKLENVSFKYNGAGKESLININLDIPKATSIGVIGGTGAGKTTLLDIILGLLTPTSGVLKIDDITVSENNLRSWQASVGYVPQHIFLVDESVSANIALGVPEKDIDLEKVEYCAKMAQIHEFVLEKLPEAYKTKLGERGVRLSGGQRQRIGIARALYNDPSVLVFDEATSALDNVTEKQLMKAINSFSGKITTITVAHRLSTVRACDVIYLLDEGSIVDRGTYDELSARSKLFSMHDIEMSGKN